MVPCQWLTSIPSIQVGAGVGVGAGVAVGAGVGDGASGLGGRRSGGRRRGRGGRRCGGDGRFRGHGRFRGGGGRRRRRRGGRCGRDPEQALGPVDGIHTVQGPDALPVDRGDPVPGGARYGDGAGRAPGLPADRATRDDQRAGDEPRLRGRRDGGAGAEVHAGAGRGEVDRRDVRAKQAGRGIEVADAVARLDGCPVDRRDPVPAVPRRPAATARRPSAAGHDGRRHDVGPHRDRDPQSRRRRGAGSEVGPALSRERRGRQGRRGSGAQGRGEHEDHRHQERHERRPRPVEWDRPDGDCRRGEERRAAAGHGWWSSGWREGQRPPPRRGNPWPLGAIAHGRIEPSGRDRRERARAGASPEPCEAASSSAGVESQGASVVPLQSPGVPLLLAR